jgi:PAS domain S-box-containing protein
LWQVVDEVADAVVMIDESQQIVVFNRAAREMFGFGAADVMGEPLEMLLPAGAGDRHKHHVDDFAASEVTQRPMSKRRTLMGRRRDGEESRSRCRSGRSILAVGGCSTP